MDVDPTKIVLKERLHPGKMLLVDIFKYFKLILKILQFRKMMIREIYIILNHQEMKMI